MSQFVSIIIPVNKINDYIRESVPKILELDYDDYEIIIFPDYNEKETFSKTKIIPTGKVSPAIKRDMALKYAKGELLAFIDDDAYPKKDWLKKVVRHFDNTCIGAVGGPNMTPPDDSISQRASGLVFATFIGSGNMAYRYVPGKRRFVDDFPSVNLIVRKDVFEEVGGFDNEFWPGEDTKLCMDIVQSGKKILYDPEAIVYHHRRKLFMPHLKQVYQYSKHRGYFAKKLPKTSFRMIYFLPSLFSFGVIGGAVLSMFSSLFFKIYITALGVYLLAVVIDTCIRKEKFIVKLLAIITIIFTHIVYGTGFMQGLAAKDFKSRLND